MTLNQNEQTLLLEKINEKLLELKFGKLNILLNFSDGHFMYFDIMETNNERIYVHSKPEENKDNKFEQSK